MFKFSINNDRFIEYLNAYPGQYSIRCEHLLINKTEDESNKDKEWITTGYIYKSFNKAENRYNYSAKDAFGSPIFTDITELHLIKKEFHNHGENLAQNVKMAQIPTVNKVNTPIKQNLQSTNRKQEINQLRDKKDKTQLKEVAKQVQKAKMLKTEKQMDALQTEKSKSDKENNKDAQSKESLSNDSKPENESNNQEQDRANERMDELQDIREQGDDLSQDMEIDM